MIEEINFSVEHKKADLSNVDTVGINGKVFLSADRILKIIDKVDDKYRYNYYEASLALGEVESAVLALKGGEQE